MGYGGVQKFPSANFGALKRYFGAITTACSTGPTFGVCVFVTSRASGFLFRSEAGFARATSSFTRGLGPLIFLTPPYPDGVGACFQMAACSSAGLISGEEYLRAQASLWSIDGPGAPHKQAFREQRVADILLPQDRKVGINLFAKPTLATAWVLKASWKDGHDILYRDLKNESQGRTPYFCSKSYWGTVPDLQAQGLTLDPLPSAVYCVAYQAAKESDGRPSASHTSWVMPNCWHRRSEDRRRGSTHPLNTRLALTKPCKAYASFQCEQVKPRWKLLSMLTLGQQPCARGSPKFRGGMPTQGGQLSAAGSRLARLHAPL